MSNINNRVREYIRLAIIETVNEKCPGYSQHTKDLVINASMAGLHVTRDVLYRAIEIASRPPHGYITPPQGAIDVVYCKGEITTLDPRPQSTAESGE
jgi:hypothetical protein